MIRGTKEFLLKQTTNLILRKKIEGYSSDDLILDVMTPKTYLNNLQNATFHSLLSCYWVSGCCSDKDYEALRKRFKKLVGLIKVDKAEIEGLTVIKETETTWGNVKQTDATIAIKSLIDEMYESGVNTPKFQQIMRGLGEAFPNAEI